MAFELKLPKLFGDGKAKPAPGAATEMPITQIRLATPEGYDPLASVSLMEQLRSATSDTRTPRKLPLVGHLPIVKQFQILGVLMVTFFVFAAFMVFLDGRQASQAAASSATATEMQMLSQRLARGTALAAQGQTAAFAAVTDSRDRFKADLDALQSGGTVKGVNLDVVQDEATIKLLQDIRSRWDRVDANTQRVIDNQQSLVALSQGLENINRGNNAILDLSQQAAQQIGQAGGTLREIEYANQLVGALPAHREERERAGGGRGDRSRSRVPARQGRQHVPRRRERPAQGQRAAASSPPCAARTRGPRSTELQKRFAAYDTGVGAILQNMNRLVAAKQAARGVNNESEALLGDTTQPGDRVRERRRRAPPRSSAAIVLRAAGARRAAAPRQGLP